MKHYSPKTNKMESCVGPDRCQYGGDELAVHFEDHEVEKAQRYTDETNQKLFGLFPKSDYGSKAASRKEVQELIESGDLGPLHTAEDLAELESSSHEYDYGEALSNAKLHHRETAKDLSYARQDSEGVGGSAFSKLRSSYEHMMDSYYRTAKGSEAEEYEQLLSERIPEADNAYDELLNEVDAFEAAKRKLIDFNHGEGATLGRRPLIFGRAKFDKRKVAHTRQREELEARLGDARLRYENATRQYTAKAAVIYDKIKKDLARIEEEENTSRQSYAERKKAVWLRGFEEGKAPEMPKNWGHPQDAGLMAETMRKADS